MLIESTEFHRLAEALECLWKKKKRRFHHWMINSLIHRFHKDLRQVTPRQKSLCAGLAAARPRSHRVKLGNRATGQKRGEHVLLMFFHMCLHIFEIFWCDALIRFVCPDTSSMRILMKTHRKIYSKKHDIELSSIKDTWSKGSNTSERGARGLSVSSK